LTQYAADPEARGYAHKSLKNELTTLKQAVPWLIGVSYRKNKEPTRLKVRIRGGSPQPNTVRRVLVREVIGPRTERFPTPEGERGFKDGRLHSFRHAFCSTYANSGVPERMVMAWLGHHDSAMIRHYDHLQDELARRTTRRPGFLGGAGGRSAAAEGESTGGDAGS